MKRFLIVFIASVIYAGFASAQERSGKVTDNNGRPVEFATVALLTEDGQAAVTVTDTLHVLPVIRLHMESSVYNIT